MLRRQLCLLPGELGRPLLWFQLPGVLSDRLDGRLLRERFSRLLSEWVGGRLLLLWNLLPGQLDGRLLQHRRRLLSDRLDGRLLPERFPGLLSERIRRGLLLGRDVLSDRFDRRML